MFTVRCASTVLLATFAPLSPHYCSGTPKVPMYGMSARCTVVSAVISGVGSRQLNRTKVSVIEMILPMPSSSFGKFPIVSIARRPVCRTSDTVYGVLPLWGHTRVSC
jgi:hypothetical protein